MSMQICLPVIDEETGKTASVCVPLAHIPIEKRVKEGWPGPHFKVDKDFDALFDPFVNPEEISEEVQTARKDLVVLSKVDALLAQLTPELAKPIESVVNRAFGEARNAAQLGTGTTITKR